MNTCFRLDDLNLRVCSCKIILKFISTVETIKTYNNLHIMKWSCFRNVCLNKVIKPVQYNTGQRHQQSKTSYGLNLTATLSHEIGFELSI